MHRNPTLHTWMHRNHHPSSNCIKILPLTHEYNEIVTPQVNTPESYPSHMNAPKSSSLRIMHRDRTPHTCTEIVIPQINAPESYPSHMNTSKSSIPQVNALEPYPSHMNEPKSSLLRWIHWNPTPHTWIHRNHHPSSKYSWILSLTQECTEIVTPQVNAPKSYPSHMNVPKLSSLR